MTSAADSLTRRCRVLVPLPSNGPLLSGTIGDVSVINTPYEALGDRRFQAFAQSLLTYEFPDLLAFPVGQPDGGRDAVSVSGKRAKEFAVFQVKFVERPNYLEDAEEWARSILASERVSIESLIEQGADKYYLITNVPGSAHPGSGSIDKVHVALGEGLEIEFHVWWRTDLEIRLSKHRELKWHYRELMTGQDVFDELISSGLTEDVERRRSAIHASMARQYRDDSTVRFKQVDLHSGLLDLFIDVPIESNYMWRSVRRNALTSVNTRAYVDMAVGLAYEPVGGADLVLDGPVVGRIGRLVIEGAPGQGKSTLAQYVCQVHRMQLLGKGEDLARITERHRQAGTRLPFKVDLRDLAVFLRGEDPYAEVAGWTGFDADTPRTLEGFLAAQVKRYSGGADFSVSDLHAVLRTGPVLLVLDGLDEVADVQDRKTIVEMVEGGLASLDAVARGLHVVVTSRPSDAAGGAAFSTRDWSYLSLGSLSYELIAKYADQWSLAKELAVDDAQELKVIVEEKVREPHLRDLARNPMQLAILLTLINTRGESLPDKRTQLYQAYMDTFFDRESTKSTVVRAHRELLFGLHGYLAWSLHSGAERAPEQGSITLSDLRAEVGTYLQRSGADQSLEEELFQGVTERIFALVATRQERFEFEVQPLREFFAAFHLFTTAQVSQMGVQHPGTRADRLAALVRNRFWSNVVRFYVGFYSSGELPGVADELEALAQEEEFRWTSTAREVATSLLLDWSFSLDTRSRERVTRLVVEGLGDRHMMDAIGLPQATTLPGGSGGAVVASKALELLKSDRLPVDRFADLGDLLDRHTEAGDFRRYWIEGVEASEGTRRSRWLRLGVSPSNLFEGLSDADVERFLLSDSPHAARLAQRAWYAVVGGAQEAVLRSGELATEALRYALSRPESALTAVTREGPPEGLLTGAAAAWAMVSRPLDGMQLSPGPGWAKSVIAAESLPSGLEVLVDLARDLESAGGVRERGAGWTDAIEAVRRFDPDGWSAARAAIAVASRLMRPKAGGRPQDLVGAELPLLTKAFAARARSGASSDRFWQGNIEGAEAQEDLRFLCSAALTWTTGDALRSVLDPVTEFVSTLSDWDFADLLELVEHVGRSLPRRPTGLTVTQIKRLHPRVAEVLIVQATDVERERLWAHRLTRYRGTDFHVVAWAANYALRRARTEDDWESALSWARKAVRTGAPPFALRPIVSPPVRFAPFILNDAMKYPLALVTISENDSTYAAASRRSTVASVARTDRWFADR